MTASRHSCSHHIGHQLLFNLSREVDVRMPTLCSTDSIHSSTGVTFSDLRQPFLPPRPIWDRACDDTKQFEYATRGWANAIPVNGISLECPLCAGQDALERVATRIREAVIGPEVHNGGEKWRVLYQGKVFFLHDSSGNSSILCPCPSGLRATDSEPTSLAGHARTPRCYLRCSHCVAAD